VPLTQPIADVLREWRFWRVAMSFGVCGFHVAFMAVHMPGVIERCGLRPCRRRRSSSPASTASDAWARSSAS